MLKERKPDLLENSLWTKLSELLKQHMGLYYPNTRLMELKRGIAAAASDMGMKSAEAYAEHLLSMPIHQKHIETLAKYLTVGETYFFRDGASFEALEYHILPAIQKKSLEANRRLRIWSAACCTGEEPYSIAIVLSRVIPKLTSWNITLLSTDIDPEFLKKAQEGIYNQWSFRNAPSGIQKAYFRSLNHGRFAIHDSLKEMVTFSYLNLVKDVYPAIENGTNAMDIIFCRNVLMYFEPSQAQLVIHKLTQSLVDGGWLFFSSVDIPPNMVIKPLVPVHINNTLVYRKEPQEMEPQSVSVEDSTLCSPVSKVTDSETETTKAKLLRGAATMAQIARKYANQGQLDKAQYWCEKALSTDKMNPGWWYLQSIILQERDMTEEALTAMKRSLYLDPHNPMIHVALGNLFQKKGKKKEAQRHYKNALALLNDFEEDAILPDSEGITARRLAEFIRTMMTTEV